MARVSPLGSVTTPTEPSPYPDPRRTMTGTQTRVKRLILAALVVVPTFVFSLTTISAAAPPSKQQVEDAKRQLAQLQSQFEAAVEKWNTAKVELQQAQTHLAAAKA